MTTTERAEKIKSEGIVPRSENTLYKYPERVYLLSGRYKGKANGNTNDVNVVYVDADEFPDDFLIYADPNQEGGYFTYMEIKQEWIYRIGNLKDYSPLAY